MNDADARRRAPATERNRGPILDVLRRVWDAPGCILEIASGSGEHAIAFARALPHLRWQPTDLDPGALASIDAWRDDAGLSNVSAAVRLDVCETPWPAFTATGLFCANMIHIAPWACTLALFDGAARMLPAGARVVLYGPFAIDGAHTAPSNAAFDRDLRSRDASWGVRDLAEVLRVADNAGFREVERVAMPANNLIVVLARAADDGLRPPGAQVIG